MANTKLYASLYDNVLTEQEGDYSARPKSTGTMYNADVAAQIVKERTEYRPETIENILSLADEVKCRFISEGRTVIDGVGQYSVVIKGVFDGPTAPFDRTKHHLISSYSAGKMLREQLSVTDVITEEFAGGGPVINIVCDPTDPGSRDQLPFRGMVLIEGTKLALRGEDPEVGITFTPVDAASGDAPAFIKAAQCFPNTAGKLQFALPPEVGVGNWRVKVATQFSNSNTFTKVPRVYEYPNIVNVY